MSLSILLIEDSPTDAAILMAAFEEMGYLFSIEIATNGIAAIEWLEAAVTLTGDAAHQHKLPELILLDLNLPRKSGLEVLKEIKQHPLWKRIPTIVLSSSSSQSDINKSYQFHANAYLSKPRELAQYQLIAQQLHSFWVEAVKLPSS